MRRRHQLVPAMIEGLEERVVLSHASVAMARVAETAKAANTPVVTGVEEVFSLFQNDYNQARATYFTSIQNQPSPSASTMYAFTAYTEQRVSLLARQTESVLAPVSPHLGGPHGVKRLITQTIMGPRAQMPSGSLANALLQSMPQPGTTAPTSSLYTLGQNNAIASAEVGILNALQKH